MRGVVCEDSGVRGRDQGWCAQTCPRPGMGATRTEGDRGLSRARARSCQVRPIGHNRGRSRGQP